MKIFQKISLRAQSIKAKCLSSVSEKYLKCQEGVAAIEFAFVAPVMIAMYFGLAEVALAIAVDRNISHSANVAGDLTTQTAEVTPAEMSQIMTATMLVMGIPDERRSDVKIEIASYAKTDDGSATGTLAPRGIATYNGAFPTPFNANTLDESILSTASGIVVARITYTYAPLKLRFLPNDIELSETFLLKPRKSTFVEIKDIGGNFNTFNCSDNASTGNVDC